NWFVEGQQPKHPRWASPWPVAMRCIRVASLLCLVHPLRADGPPATSVSASTTMTTTTTIAQATTTTTTTSTTAGTTTTTTRSFFCTYPVIDCLSSSGPTGSTSGLALVKASSTPDYLCDGAWGRPELTGNVPLLCEDGFGAAEAEVACRQLGYQRGIVALGFRGGSAASLALSSGAVMLSPNCTGSETRLQDCPDFGVSADSTCSPSRAAGVMCAGRSYTDAELFEVCPRLQLRYNNQQNRATHPLGVVTVFPGGSFTSGFGGTGVSTSQGGLGNYGGTYRNMSEIREAWSAILPNELPGMGGHQYKYSFATKSFCYSNLELQWDAASPCNEQTPIVTTTTTTQPLGFERLECPPLSKLAGQKVGWLFSVHRVT
ncbi:unnamed protein product, partial [Effrenium voratum]